MRSRLATFLHHPLSWLVATVVLLALRDFVWAERGLRPGPDDGKAIGLIYGYIASCWVSRDQCRYPTGVPSDQVMICTSVFLPVHLWRSRRWRGVGIFVVLLALLVMAALVGFWIA